MILLHRYVRKETAARWRDLGVELTVSDAKLDNITEDFPRDVERCCSEMLSYWLRNDPQASWNKLIEALKHIGKKVLAKNIEIDILKGFVTSYVCTYIITYCSCS